MKSLGLLLIGFSLCLALAGQGWSQNKVRTSVGADVLEKILASLEIKFEKIEPKDKEKDTFLVRYDFQAADQPCRLLNYGNDIWLECLFDKSLKLEDVNRWNASAKFSRAVLLEQKDKKTVVSLEAQLDCLGGATDAMIKQFVIRFDEETKKFVKTLLK